MKKLFATMKEISRKSAGFTLIELLVVIAIIGILAVAVLAAINPIEQINKGRDTQANADASQLLGAVERYYTNSNPAVYPWNVAVGAFTPASIDPTVAYTMNSTPGHTAEWRWLDNLSATQEVKDTFANRLKTSKQFVIFRAAGSNVPTYICYYPVSNSSRKNADSYCATNGTTINAAAGVTLCQTPGAGVVNPICIP